jgi:hypothetical protein
MTVFEIVERSRFNSNGFWDNCQRNFANRKRQLAKGKSDYDKMDYVMLLFAFEKPSPKRDAEIKAITDEFLKKAKAKDSCGFEMMNGEKVSFDGSDESMVSILRIFSCLLFAESPYYDGYSIPCVVVKKKLALINSIDSYFGSRRDESLPHCSPGWRGNIKNFSDSEIRHYKGTLWGPTVKERDALGSIKYGIDANIRHMQAKAIFLPQEFLQLHIEPDEYIQNVLNQPECREAFDKAKASLIKYYRKQFSFSRKQSETAANNALLSMIPDYRISESKPGKDEVQKDKVP